MRKETKDGIKAWLFIFSAIICGGIIAGMIVCTFLYIYWGI